jgi:hypothetical protein
LSWVKVKVKVTLRLTVGQSVSKSWCRAPSGVHDQRFITVWQLRFCVCGAPSLTRGRVCLLYMLLALASAVFLRPVSLGTSDHILLSPIRDFPFRRLLRLAGTRWRYSTPPPHRYSFLSWLMQSPWSRFFAYRIGDTLSKSSRRWLACPLLRELNSSVSVG